MALAKMMKNTDRAFPCVQCGSSDTSIIREDAANPRLKCNQCSFMYDGKDSQNASEAGAIKPSSQESLADASEPDMGLIPDFIVDEMKETINRPYASEVTNVVTSTYNTIPQNPAYVFLTKNRQKQELVTKRDFKKVAVRWSQAGSFDVYELKKIKLNVKVNIT